MTSPAAVPGDYTALLCITTCERVAFLRRHLPHFARLCSDDQRFALLVALDGDDPATRAFCDEWEVPLIYSDEREGVGISKNRALTRFPGYDCYFFVEDDVELVDGSVFPTHVELARASGLHHLSLWDGGEVRQPTGESRISGHRIAHGRYGSADFSFYTRECLKRVGGWHPLFAKYRRWGHTEHSYRIARAGLVPAPFNAASDLAASFIWHAPPAVTRVDNVVVDADQIAEPERRLIDDQLEYVPVETRSPHHVNGFSPGPAPKLAEAVRSGDRYPLVGGRERRRARSSLALWRSATEQGRLRRGAALAKAIWNWPANPAIRHALKTRRLR